MLFDGMNALIEGVESRVIKDSVRVDKFECSIYKVTDDLESRIACLELRRDFPQIQFTAMQEVVKKLMAEVEALKAPENDIEEYREKVISEFFMRGLVINPMKYDRGLPYVRMFIKIDGNELASRATAVGHLVSERELIDDAVLRLRESILHRLEALYVPKRGV